MKKFNTMFFSAIAIFFTGFSHVWSIYAPEVMKITGWSSTQTSMCFYLSFCCFVFGNIIGGRIQDNAKPIRVLAIGGGLQALGVFLSAFMLIANPLPIYLTFGVMQGFGQGMIYAVLVSTAQKWYPQRKGFGSGLVIMFNGLSGLLLAPLSRMVISRYGPAEALQVIAALMLAAWLLSVIFVRVPEGAGSGIKRVEDGAVRQYSSREMLATGRFYLLVGAMLFGLISYLLISPIAHEVQLEGGLTDNTATYSIMIGAVLNALARIIVPTLSDKLGRIFVIRIVFLLSAVAGGTLIFAGSNLTAPGIMLLFGCYGGIMGGFPALSSSLFGDRHAGENYGFVMAGVIAATLAAPLISAAVAGLADKSRLLFIIGLASSLIAAGFVSLLQRELKIKSAKTVKYRQVHE